MKKSSVILLALLLLLTLCACTKIDLSAWPTSGLAAALPTPTIGIVTDVYENDEHFTADIEKTGEDDMKTYAQQCQSAGFNIDIEDSSTGFAAYNANGLHLRLSYSSYSKEYSITLEKSKVSDALKWPTMGLATIIPKPEISTGSIATDTADDFRVYVGNTDPEKYSAYVEECMTAGFNIDYHRSETKYWADNADGEYISVEYVGFNTMYIKVSAAEEDEPAVPNNPTEENPGSPTEKPTTPNSSGDGVDSDFKAAMDSYEAFFREYVDFMKEFYETDDVLSMMDEYSELMTQYTETMSKLNDIDEADLNEAELLYYIEVTARINAMLLEIA